jgi:hypothetical protein
MNINIAIPILLIGSSLLIIFGVGYIWKIQSLKKKGEEVIGIISGFQQSAGLNFNYIYPEVTYVTNDKLRITKTSQVSSIPGYYKVGQKINIIYRIDKPESFIIKSKNSYIVPIIMIAFGLLFIVYIFILSKI